MNSTSYTLGIDLGGTRVKALAASPEGRMLDFLAASTEGEDWAENVRAVAQHFEKRLGQPRGVGIAAPGLVAEDERSITHMPGRLQGLERLDWTTYLGAPSTVYVVNDGHAALLGEIWQGAAADARNAILITLGTGVGGAAMVDGRILHGHIGRAGHLGHISIDPRGLLDIVNTPGSLEDAVGNASINRRSGGRYTSTLQLAEGFKNGDPIACQIWQRMIEDLAAALASLINVLDPSVVVIGGGISEAGDLLFVPLKQQLARFEWRPAGHTVKVVRAALGNRAGAFGAAWLVHSKQISNQ